MPTGDFDSKPSWADQVEEEGEDDKCVTSELLKGIPLATGDTSPEPELLPGAPLPSPKEVINGNIKTLTEYKIDEDGKKFKIVRTFRIETRKASKAVARRKNWKKFGNSEFDPPGPNVATTTVSDDVSMTFITSKEDLNCQEEEDPMNKLKGQKIVSCRICKGDHWTTRCPYKDTLGPMQKELAEQLGLSTGEKEKLPGELEPVQATQNKTGKYVPPSLRDGASRRGESMQPNRRADDNATIRVTNLSEDTRETDLQELFRPFGSISRIYLAKDKTTGQSKAINQLSRLLLLGPQTRDPSVTEGSLRKQGAPRAIKDLHHPVLFHLFADVTHTVVGGARPPPPFPPLLWVCSLALPGVTAAGGNSCCSGLGAPWSHCRPLLGEEVLAQGLLGDQSQGPAVLSASILLLGPSVS
uniref:Eukaryotic translation initiation factor 3 subunit G n=1 Tax=Monodon monoceros TaxID=40151 RepID=A0A8C6CCB6_MONMO